MTAVSHTEARTPGRHVRDAWNHRVTGILSLLPVRCVALLAVRRELNPRRKIRKGPPGLVCDHLLDLVSRDPLYSVRVRHEFLRLLRLRKNFSPGWRRACFDASERRFGPLV